jgi:hypothetical protein
MHDFSEQRKDAKVPLVIDVDGTLLRTDLLYECFWSALGQDFFATLCALLAYWKRPERLNEAFVDIDGPP